MRTFNAKPTGTQTLDRSISVLRRISMRGRAGAGLTELAERCGLDKATTHRILSGLVRGRLVERDPATRSYRLGPLLFELSLGRPDLLGLQRACEGPLEATARELGCMAYVYVRSGLDVVLAAEAGRQAQKSFLGRVGTRKPLLHTAGGAALALALPEPEQEALVSECLADLLADGGPAHVEVAQRVLARSRELGFGVSEGHIAPHTAALAVSIRDAAGLPFAAFNAAAPQGQFGPERYGAIVTLLTQQARALEALLAKASLQA